jgi:hypothetical protein
VQASFKEEQVLRKKLHNTVEDMKGKIRVYARVRPISGKETARGNTDVVQFPDEYTLDVTAPPAEGDKAAKKITKSFQYDTVFPPASTQENVFEDTKALIQSTLDGYNVCIFAYGQTGAGKTHTMTGNPEMPGITPRAMAEIFRVIEKNAGLFQYTVSCTMMELYNDQLVDLLWKPKKKKGEEPPKLNVKRDQVTGWVSVENAIVASAATVEELASHLEAGNSRRHIAATNMNDQSSRSHLIFTIIIESTNVKSGVKAQGKLSLIDLAGSERVGKSGATGETLREAQSINKSLSALGNVISALSTGDAKHIPYRDNLLTLVMSDSIGGNAKTLMFVNLSPVDYNYDETVNSLQYASRVKLITNNAQKNVESKEVARLKALIAGMKGVKAPAVEADEVTDA